MEYPYCSPNYHLFNFHTGSGHHEPYSGASHSHFNSDGPGQHGPYSGGTSTNMPVVDLCVDEECDNRANQSSKVPSLSVKVINPSRKSEVKLFILRDIKVHYLTNPDKIRKLLVDQLGNEVSSEPNFELGYFQGNKRVWVRGREDLIEVQRLPKSNEKQCSVTLWCMGKAESQSMKRLKAAVSDSESEGETEVGESAKSKKKKVKKQSRYQEKTERIDDMVDQLKQKHATVYTVVQYRVWAETVEAGRHDSLDNPPNGSFFKAQGRKSSGKSSPTSTPEKASSPGCNSEQSTLTPSKVAGLRSTYIQQIKELHDLMEIGAIDNVHFIRQRNVLLQQMDELSK